MLIDFRKKDTEIMPPKINDQIIECSNIQVSESYN